MPTAGGVSPLLGASSRRGEPTRAVKPREGGGPHIGTRAGGGQLRGRDPGGGSRHPVRQWPQGVQRAAGAGTGCGHRARSRWPPWSTPLAPTARRVLRRGDRRSRPRCARWTRPRASSWGGGIPSVERSFPCPPGRADRADFSDRDRWVAKARVPGDEGERDGHSRVPGPCRPRPDAERLDRARGRAGAVRGRAPRRARSSRSTLAVNGPVPASSSTTRSTRPPAMTATTQRVGLAAAIAAASVRTRAQDTPVHAAQLRIRLPSFTSAPSLDTIAVGDIRRPRLLLEPGHHVNYRPRRRSTSVRCCDRPSWRNMRRNLRRSARTPPTGHEVRRRGRVWSTSCSCSG